MVYWRGRKGMFFLDDEWWELLSLVWEKWLWLLILDFRTMLVVGLLEVKRLESIVTL